MLWYYRYLCFFLIVFTLALVGEAYADFLLNGSSPRDQQPYYYQQNQNMNLHTGKKVFTKEPEAFGREGGTTSSIWTEKTKKRVSEVAKVFLNELKEIEQNLKNKCFVPQTGIKISISAQDVPVGDVLRIIADKSKKGIVLSGGATTVSEESEEGGGELPDELRRQVRAERGRYSSEGDKKDRLGSSKISLFYNHADLADVLNDISNTVGICFDVEGRSIRVKPEIDIQIPFPFSLGAEVRSSSSSGGIPWSGGSGSGSSRSNNSSIIGSGISERVGSSSSRGHSGGGGIGDEIKEGLQHLLGKDNVILSKSSGYLFLRGNYLSLIKAIRHLRNLAVDMMDYYVLRMYILRVNKSKTFDYSMSFSDLINFYGHGLSINFTPGGSAVDSSSGSIVFSIRKNPLVSFLSVLEKRGLGEIVSAPSVAVRNNSTATVDLVTQVGWVEPGDYETTMNQVTTLGTWGRPTFQTKDVGLKLDISVKSVDDSRVQVGLVVDATELDGFLTSTWQPSKDVKPVDLKYPLLSRRSFNTELLAGLGEYVILGGFREQRINSNKGGMPIMMDTPLIGPLLSSKNKTEAVSDLYIIIGFEPLNVGDTVKDVYYNEKNIVDHNLDVR